MEPSLLTTFMLSLTHPTANTTTRMPLYCMHWQFKGHPGQLKEGVSKFLSTGAPLPDTDKMIGRWHAPGSQKGWIIVETDSVAGLYEHASEWGDLLTWEVTPVLTDAEAGAICDKVWCK